MTVLYKSILGKILRRENSTSSSRNSKIRNDLRNALRSNQFRIFYQPVVNIHTGDIIAAEAFIRWQHPDLGLIYQEDLITAAEETGLAGEIGEWLLREVCRSYSKWIENGFPAIKIAINYTSAQLYQKDFAEDLRSIITEYKLDPGFLILEIIENTVIYDYREIISIIDRLHSMGIQIALDDFGTGYSPLEYLGRLNIDIIKLGRNFINKIGSDNTTNTIIKSVIDLSRALGIILIANGIENWIQLDFLKESECTFGQGYIFSRPVPQYDFVGLLAAGKCKPSEIMHSNEIIREGRRKYFRVKFPLLLESSIVVLSGGDESPDTNIKIGGSKVLIEDMGPGGLCFISNIKLQLKKGMLLQFNFELMGKSFSVTGTPARIETINNILYKYGVQFNIDKSSSESLSRALNLFYNKMREFDELSYGNFAKEPPISYFSHK